MLVQSVRRVGSRRGYSYSAYGLYRSVRRARDGVLTWRLIGSGPWFRSDVYGRTRFPGVPVVRGVRHGKPLVEWSL